MSSAAAYPAYPARMEARMDQPLSRPGGPEPGGA